MTELKECGKIATLQPELLPDKLLTVKDYAEVIVAGLSLLLGMGISIRGCASYINKERNVEKEANKSPALEQRVDSNEKQRRIPATLKLNLR